MNKTSVDAAADYCAGVRALGRYAGYLVVNVSSPNTPGLRDLQQREQLTQLLRAVRAEVDALPQPRPPLVLKMSPDVDAAGRRDIAAVALAEKVDGIIVSNTTVTRPGAPLVLKMPAAVGAAEPVDVAVVGLPERADGIIVSNFSISRPQALKSSAQFEAGGLSGAPLMDLSTETLRDMYRLTKGRITLIGSGGISSGADAYAKLRAGASAVQLYTALVYEGPTVVAR
jgi:dihydroorotate dehydrogenase